MARRPFCLTLASFAFVGALLWGAPTGAIETATFGLDVAEASEDARLHIPIAAGETSRRDILVWNKQPTPLRLRLSIAPAVVDKAGKATLGGDDSAPVDWVDVPQTVGLAPQERRRVTVEVRAPRKIEPRTRSVAVIAEPAAAEGADAPAVLQRLALTTFLEPQEGSFVASLGPFPWIALGILLLVGAAVARWLLERRGSASRSDEAPPE